ncbi:arginase family protein [Filimonas effusa]|uniref:Agmatinase n=1 Tax=Filimonas effusa TaxID=2508721 RepID=A0A4Q1DA87_9BACT|nr:arginase family protein [Filimonas effusa]RXK85808.1 agmatinase [Filimonas effusa]
MADLSGFDPNLAGNPHNNIFGLPFTEEEAALVLLPVPWEVTVSCTAGTARCAEHIFKASLQVDLFDADIPNGWKEGFYMREVNKKILLKSDYLRKEAELYIDYISKGEAVEKNKFMCKSLRDINEGSLLLNDWVYEQTRELLQRNKLVALIGGDHSTPLGLWKALAEQHGDFGILQIDAHSNLRTSYGNFKYSHASVMHNALSEIPHLTKLVQLGVRDYSETEHQYVANNPARIACFLDRNIKERIYEGDTWKSITNDIIAQLPQKVHISFDIDGLDPKLCPHAGTPVPGGFDIEPLLYLFKRIIESGRQLISFDLVEIGVGEQEWDANVGAHLLWRLCNLMIKSKQQWSTTS